MIGRIITRGRNSGLKCLSTGSLSPFPFLFLAIFPQERACSQATCQADLGLRHALLLHAWRAWWGWAGETRRREARLLTCLQQSFPFPLGQAGQERNLEDARGKTEQKCMKEMKGNAYLLDRFSVWERVNKLRGKGKGLSPSLSRLKS